MNELTHVDLFSGIGGFALAARWAGFRTTVFSEIDPYASAVLRKHWPDVPNVGDITKADFSPYAGATLLTGGFPCQPFSVAGKRLGTADPRHLWPSMLGAIRIIRPAWIVGENVDGIHALVLHGIKSALEGEGYRVRIFRIPACALGADHERKRVWIVANLNGMRELQQEGINQDERRWTLYGNQQVASDALRSRSQAPRERRKTENEARSIYPLPASSSFPGRESYPDLLRKIHGIPRRLDRIKALGNAIVPQVAFQILQAIAKIEGGE